MKAVIMAAGKSTRTYPLTLTKPKPLLPIANKPIIIHQLDALEGLVDGVVIVVGYKAGMLRAALGDSYKGIPLQYVEQKQQRGTGDAVLTCAEYIRDSFIALNGDDLYAAEDLARLAEVRQGALAKTVADPRLYGIYEVNAEGCAVRLVEKPKEIFSHLANIGVYKFQTDVFGVLEDTPLSERGELEVTCAVQTIARRSDFQVVEIHGHWFPIAYPWHLLDANAWFLEHRLEAKILGEVSPAAHITGAVSIGKGTVIRPGAVIDGPVCIGENCAIGPNCWIRPGSTIGNGCRIGQGVEIKNSILFDTAFASHLSYVGDSVVGESVNLGCGTITANYRHDGTHHKSLVNGVLVDTGRSKLGAIIGDNVHTGINTSIYPGRKFWPGTSTLPGAVVDRDITD